MKVFENQIKVCSHKKYLCHRAKTKYDRYGMFSYVTAIKYCGVSATFLSVREGKWCMIYDIKTFDDDRSAASMSFIDCNIY